MSKEDLIPLGKPGNEEHDKKVRAKLKGSGSDKRKIAQKIVGLKKANPENIPEKIRNLVLDPKLSAQEIMLLIEFLKTHSNDARVSDIIQLGNLMVKAHTALHGSTSKNLNVNVDLTQDQINQKVYELIGHERNNITNGSKESHTESS